MIFLHFLMALAKSIAAFFKAYDSDGGRSRLGFPLLKEWQSESPYEPFFESSNQSRMSGSRAHSLLVFDSGREKGDWVALKDPETSLGPDLHADVVVRSTPSQSFRVNIRVDERGAFIQSREASISINGIALQEALLVDQDECEFMGVRFFYLDLKKNEETDCEEIIRQAS